MTYGHQCITMNIKKEPKVILEAWDNELLLEYKKQFIIFYDLKDYNNWLEEAKKQKIEYLIYYLDNDYYSSLDN